MLLQLLSSHFQSEVVTRLDGLRACVAKEEADGEPGTSDDGGIGGGDQAHEQTPTDMSGVEDFDQPPPVLQDYRRSQEERAKASTLIQSWWIVYSTILAVMHFMEVKDFKPPARLRRAMDATIDHGCYSRRFT
ncbi:MAG: hypothetical protein ACKPKO_45480, partial [Candidatus Fonsibacter sp.]